MMPVVALLAEALYETMVSEGGVALLRWAAHLAEVCILCSVTALEGSWGQEGDEGLGFSTSDQVVPEASRRQAPGEPLPWTS